MKINKFKIPNKFPLRLAAGAVAVSLAIALIPNAYLASKGYTSLVGIELLKNEIGKSNPYNILEIVPEENTGSIGYYIPNQEASTNLILDAFRYITSNATKSAAEVRKEYIDEVLTNLRADGVLGKSNETLRPLLEKESYVYEEYKPWDLAIENDGLVNVTLADTEADEFKGTMTSADGAFDKIKTYEYVGVDITPTPDAYQNIEALVATDKDDLGKDPTGNTAANGTPDELYYAAYFEKVKSNSGNSFDEEYLNRAFYTLVDVQPPRVGEDTVTFDLENYQYVDVDGELQYAIKRTNADGSVDFIQKGDDTGKQVATDVVEKNAEGKYVYTHAVSPAIEGAEVIKHDDGRFYASGTTDFTDITKALDVVEQVEADTFEYFGFYGDEYNPVNLVDTYFVATVYAGPFEDIDNAHEAIIPTEGGAIPKPSDETETDYKLQKFSPATPFIGIGSDITDKFKDTLPDEDVDANEDGTIEENERLSHIYVDKEVLATDETLSQADREKPENGYMPGVKPAFRENSNTYIYVGEGEGDYNFTSNDTGDDLIIYYDEIYFELPYTNNRWFHNHALDYDDGELDEAIEEFPAIVNSKTPREVTIEDINSAEMIVISSAFRLIDTADPTLLLNYGDDITETGVNEDGDEIEITYTNDFQTEELADRIIERVSVDSLPLILDGAISDITETTEIGTLVAGYVDDDDEKTTGFVNESVYYFPSATQLAQEGFYTKEIENSATITDASPYYQVYSQIVTENTLRDTQGEDEEDRIPVDINMATSFRSIMSFAERLVENKKDSIRVLEIQPKVVMEYDETDDAINKKASDLTADYVSKELLKGEIPPEKIEIVTMSTAEFNASIDNVVENYDMVYIGGSLNGFNTDVGVAGESVTNFNDDSMDGMLYTNIGDSYLMDNGNSGSVYHLGGWLNSDYSGNNLLAYKESSLPDDDDVILARFSGTDITDLKQQQLQEFADSGYPVIISDELIVPEEIIEENLTLTITGTPISDDDDDDDDDDVPDDAIYKFEAQLVQSDSLDVTDRVTIEWTSYQTLYDKHWADLGNSAIIYAEEDDVRANGNLTITCLVTLPSGTTVQAEFIPKKESGEWISVNATATPEAQGDIEVTIKAEKNVTWHTPTRETKLEVLNPTQEQVDPHKISFQWYYNDDLDADPGSADFMSNFTPVPSQVNRIYITEDVGYFYCEVSIVNRFTDEATDKIISEVARVESAPFDPSVKVSSSGAYVHDFNLNDGEFIGNNSTVYPSARISYSGPRYFPITTDINNGGNTTDGSAGWEYTSEPVINFTKTDGSEVTPAELGLEWNVFSTYGHVRPAFKVNSSGVYFPGSLVIEDIVPHVGGDVSVEAGTFNPVQWNNFPVFKQNGSNYNEWYVNTDISEKRDLEGLIGANKFSVTDYILSGVATNAGTGGHIGTGSSDNMNNNNYFGAVASIEVKGETFYSFADYVRTEKDDGFSGISRAGMNFMGSDATVDVVPLDTLYDIKGTLEKETTTFFPLATRYLGSANNSTLDEPYDFTLEAITKVQITDWQWNNIDGDVIWSFEGTYGYTPKFTYTWYKYDASGAVKLEETSNKLDVTLAPGEEYIVVVSDGHDYVYEIRHYTLSVNETRETEIITDGGKITVPSRANTAYGQVDETRVDNSSKTYEYLDNLVDKQTDEGKYKNVFTEARAESDDDASEVLKYLNLSKPMIEFTVVDDDGEDKEIKPSQYIDEYFGGIYEFRAQDVEAGLKPGEGGTEDTTGNSGIKDALEDEFGGRELYYEFTIENPTDTNPANTRYEMKLYVDLNSDGRYSGEQEEIEDLVIKEHEDRATEYDGEERTDGEVAENGDLSAGVVYTVRRDLPENFRYAIPWKLEVVEVVDEDEYAPHNSQEGVTFRARDGSEPMPVIKVLQVKASYNTPIIAKMDTYDGGKYRYDGHDYVDGVDGELLPEQGIPEYEAAFNQLYANDIYDIQLEVITLSGMNTKAEAEELETYLNGFDMVILGFAGSDAYDGAATYKVDGKTHTGISPASAVEILNYIESGRTTLFTPGVMTSQGVPTVNYPMTSGDTGSIGSRSLQSWMLRDIAGLDVYGITDTEYGFSDPVEEFYNNHYTSYDDIFKIDSTNAVADKYDGADIGAIIDDGYSIAYQPDSAKDDYVKETQGFSNYQYITYGKPSSGGNNMAFAEGVSTVYTSPTTKQVAQVNEGQITSFPYDVNISSLENSNEPIKDEDLLNTRSASPLPFQLNMNSDEIAVWYTLESNSKSGYFNNSYKDPVNNAFIYNMGNVTYIGISGGLIEHPGIDTPDDEKEALYEQRAAEAKLFTNTIISAYRSSASTTGIQMVDPGTGHEITTHFVPRPTEDIMNSGSILNAFESKLAFELSDNNLTESTFTALELYYEDSAGTHYMIDGTDVNLVDVDGNKLKEGTMIPTTTSVYTLNGDNKLVEATFSPDKPKYAVYDYFGSSENPVLVKRTEIPVDEDGNPIALPKDDHGNTIADGTTITKAKYLESNAIYTIVIPNDFIDNFSEGDTMASELTMYLSVKTETTSQNDVSEKVEVVSYSNVLKLRQLGLIELN